jgi:hypothetical protein
MTLDSIVFRLARLLDMAETPPDIGQARRDAVVSPPRQSALMRLLARKVLEDRAANRQLQEMMYIMNMNQTSNGISGEISALKELIVILSH